MIEAIESTVMSFVWLAGDYLYGFEPHVSADTIRRFIAHFGTHGLLLHSIAQIVQLGIMTKEMEASFGCDCVTSVVISVDDLYKSTMAEFTNDRQEE